MEAKENAQFKIEGGKIVSVSSGNTVAVIENGNIVMQAGYNPMTRKVQEFYDSIKDLPTDSPAAPDAAPADPEFFGNDDIEDEEFLPENEFARDHTAELPVDPAGLADDGNTNVFVGSVPAAGGTSAPVQEMKSNPDAQFVIDSIPDDELPELDPVLGVNTRSFKLFVKLYKLTPEQISCLVRRLELKMRG